MAAADPRFKICYFLPHSLQDLGEASFLGGYTPGLHEAASPLMLIATMPADIREPFTERPYRLLQRQLRIIRPMIVPIQSNALEEALTLAPAPFRVCITTAADVAAQVDAICRDAWPPILHVSSLEGARRVSASRLTTKSLMTYVLSVLGELSDKPTWSRFVAEARAVTRAEDAQANTRHGLARGAHNVTLPNEAALQSMGWLLPSVERVVPVGPAGPGGGMQPSRYIRRICEGADAVTDARKNLLGNFSPELVPYRYIVAVNGVQWTHYKGWRQRIGAQSKEERKVARLIFDTAVRGETYFDQMHGGKGWPAEAFLFVARERAADASSFTAGLVCLATASFTPVLRLEPKLHRIRGDIKTLAECIRYKADDHFAWKTSRLIRQLSEKMRSLIAPEFLSRIDRRDDDGPIEGLKLVSDLPLELMRSDGLPLSLRFDLSRTFVVPGNMYLANCLMPPAFVPLSAFHDVLVIRSFANDDPLRSALERGLSVVGQERPTVKAVVRFVDVNTEDEFVAALEGFEGALMIFDGHGRYDGESGMGQLVVGGEALDTWSLRSRCHFPPIVVFSACDTQPLDGSHGSVATSAFVLGARAVLATAFPVNGIQASILIGRLILRIQEFLPAVLKHRSTLSWREVVSGLMRMSYVTEVMDILEREGKVRLLRKDRDSVQMTANVSINQRQQTWHEKFVSAYAAKAGMTVDQVREYIDKWAGLPEAITYLQLGAPENVILLEEGFDEFSSRQQDLRAKVGSPTSSAA